MSFLVHRETAVIFKVNLLNYSSIFAQWTENDSGFFIDTKEIYCLRFKICSSFILTIGYYIRSVFCCQPWYIYFMFSSIMLAFQNSKNQSAIVNLINKFVSTYNTCISSINSSKNSKNYTKNRKIQIIVFFFFFVRNVIFTE